MQVSLLRKPSGPLWDGGKKGVVGAVGGLLQPSSAFPSLPSICLYRVSSAPALLPVLRLDSWEDRGAKSSLYSFPCIYLEIRSSFRD